MDRFGEATEAPRFDAEGAVVAAGVAGLGATAAAGMACLEETACFVVSRRRFHMGGGAGRRTEKPAATAGEWCGGGVRRAGQRECVSGFSGSVLCFRRWTGPDRTGVGLDPSPPCASSP